MPIWHNINKQGVEKNFPIILDRFALKSSQGIDYITQGILVKIRPSLSEFKLKFLKEIADSAAIIRENLEKKYEKCKELGLPSDGIISLFFSALSEFEDIILKASEAGNISELESIKKKVESLFKTVIGYCVNCRVRDSRMILTKEVRMRGKGGARRALRGKCAVCGTEMFHIIGKA